MAEGRERRVDVPDKMVTYSNGQTPNWGSWIPIMAKKPQKSYSASWEKRCDGHVGYRNKNVPIPPQRFIYEFSVGQPGQKKTVVYLGSTETKGRRLEDYKCAGSHLSGEINDTLKRGYVMYIRIAQTRGQKAAEKNLLKKYEYLWNIVDNSKK